MVFVTIELTGEDRLLTVRMEGEIDHNSVEMIRNSVEKEIRRTGALNIAFDFSGVSFMDSSGVGLIMGRFKTVSSLGGKIIIYGMNNYIERIMRMSGIEKIAEIY